MSEKTAAEIANKETPHPYEDATQLYRAERLENETYEQYKVRQRLLRVINKTKKQGVVAWQSMFRGTMTEEANGRLIPKPLTGKQFRQQKHG